MSPRFTRYQQFRFALWFCRHDLFEIVARPLSVAVILAITLSTAAACVALALPWVTEEIRLRRLAASPWARCIWVSVNHPLDRKLSPARLAELEAAIDKNINTPDSGFVVSVFHDIHNLDFYKLSDGRPLHCKGRTIGGNDALLPAVPDLLASGAGFNRADGRGVILSPRLVERLGGSLQDPPKAIRIRLPATGRDHALNVAGVTRDPLPLGYDFLITEAEDESLRAADTSNPQGQVWSGPLGPDWPTRWSKFPEVLQELASKESSRGGWEIHVEVVQRLKGPVLELTADDPRSVNTWRTYLILINERMMEGQYKEAPDFDSVEIASSGNLPPPESRGPYLKACVYVRQLKDLRPAADAVRGLDLYANDASRTLVDEIETTADQAKWLVLWLVGGFCLAGFISLVLTLYLRGQQKKAQVGMLRAMGANDKTMRMIVMMETALVWSIGTTAGLVVAVAIGFFLCRHYAVTRDELSAAAGTGRWLIADIAFLACSLVGCIVGNLYATHRVRHRPAAESLGLSS